MLYFIIPGDEVQRESGRACRRRVQERLGPAEACRGTEATRQVWPHGAGAWLTAWTVAYVN